MPKDVSPPTYMRRRDLPGATGVSSLRRYLFVDADNLASYKGRVYRQLWHWATLVAGEGKWHVFVAGIPERRHSSMQHLLDAGVPPDCLSFRDARYGVPDDADRILKEFFARQVPRGVHPVPHCILATRDGELIGHFVKLAIEKGVHLNVVFTLPQGQSTSEVLVEFDWLRKKTGVVSQPQPVSREWQRQWLFNRLDQWFTSHVQAPVFPGDLLEQMQRDYQRWLLPFSLEQHLHPYFPGLRSGADGLARSDWEYVRQGELVWGVIHEWFGCHPRAPFLPPNGVAALSLRHKAVLRGESLEMWLDEYLPGLFDQQRGLARKDWNELAQTGIDPFLQRVGRALENRPGNSGGDGMVFRPDLPSPGRD